MAVDADALAAQMFNAAFEVLKGHAPTIGAYIQDQCQKEQAAVLFEMQKSAVRSVLISAEGLSALAVEEAINAALGAVRAVVNTALGFSLI